MINTTDALRAVRQIIEAIDRNTAALNRLADAGGIQAQWDKTQAEMAVYRAGKEVRNVHPD
jgi:short-subunit dehydrogenase involved in D-alanine esterification of teichoic acids